MGRKTSVAVSVLLAVLVGALLARGCYPRRAVPIVRAPVSTAAGEAPFPEPDIDSIHARVADLMSQLASLRDRLSAGQETPQALSADFENAARIAADLDGRVREIVSRLGAPPSVGEAEANDIKALAARLHAANATLVPGVRSALAAGSKADAARALAALSTEMEGVSANSAEPAGESAADAGERAAQLKSVGENIYARVVKPAPGSAFGAQLQPLLADAARQLEEMEDALRPAAETDPGAAAALKFLESGASGAPRGSLARIARAARKGDAAAARAAARRFVRAMRGVGWTLAHAAKGATAAGAASAAGADVAGAEGAPAAGNPAALSPVFDPRAPVAAKTPRRRHRARAVPATASVPAAAASAAPAAEKSGPAGPVRPTVVVHPELIPKNIKIVRVYYATMIGAPGDTLEFDINGSGFTEEFQKQISVQSGMANVTVENAALVTPNQIHARLAIGMAAATSFAFPTVSIGDKVVFQAAEPFAAIRPGEVLNLVFTEMGENGRTGRFRIFTNLTEEQFSRFRVEPSTPAIALGNFTPRLPFIVDGSIQVGPALSGAYGVSISLDKKVLWQKDGIIRIVNPNVGQTGLVLHLQAEDGYHRPGDVARFLVQGSGFQGGDAAALSADVPGLDNANATFTYLAPGRMSLDIEIPKSAPIGPYSVRVKNGPKVLLDTLNAFRVVPPNWLRSLSTTPPLKPGGTGQLVLQGRSLQKNFVDGLRVAVDEPGLKIGRFQRVSAIQASADISADRNVRPGDYEVRIRSARQAIVPESGDIIRVVPAD